MDAHSQALRYSHLNLSYGRWCVVTKPQVYRLGPTAFDRSQVVILYTVLRTCTVPTHKIWLFRALAELLSTKCELAHHAISLLFCTAMGICTW